MSPQQINTILLEDKLKIMRSIFNNYNEILDLKKQSKIKVNSNNISKVELFALTDSIINLMDKNEKQLLLNSFSLKKETTNKINLNHAINKFVYYLLV